MDYRRYATVRKKIVPHLRFSQSIYEDVVTGAVDKDTIWLDAGCGWHVLPEWRREAEARLVPRARLAIGCDVDTASVAKHRTLSHRVVAELTQLPIAPESVTLITCNMVVEHLDEPLAVFAEFARILRKEGQVIVHTPNVLSHFVLVSRLLPRRLKLKLIRKLDRRQPEDVFPARYRANSPRRLRFLMKRAGLRQLHCRLLASDATLALANPMLAALELFYIRLTLIPMFRALRFTILATFGKSGSPAP